ncbi:MAG: 4Fe-4S binding protein [Candidatus Bathyarchaeia archaeon]
MIRVKGGIEELKKSGYILQRDAEYFTVRLRIPGGHLTSKQVIALGEVAERWGRGELHLTARQGIEIPWVRFEELGEVTKALDEIGTPPGSCGPRVRNISACPGLPICTHANIDTQGLAKKIDERFFDVDLPTKLKIAITGCPNSCAKPQVNDIGIMGVVRPRIISEACNGCGRCVERCREGAIKLVGGIAQIDYAKCVYCGECVRACPVGADIADRQGYTVFVGGNVGRHPRLAYKLVDFASEEMIFQIIENSLRLFEREGVRGERFGHLIERFGLGEAFRRILP